MLRVLSVDIGTTNYTCCAANFSESTELKCQCSPTTIKNITYRSIEIVDIFNVNIGGGCKGLQCLDTLISSWEDFALFQIWQPNIVLIENQFKKATVNFALSFCTYTLSKKQFPGCDVRFVKALSKFSGFKKFFPTCTHTVSLKTYKQRKTAAVDLSTKILKDYFEIESIQCLWRSEICGSNLVKKDDAGDCFLQVFCF